MVENFVVPLALVSVCVLFMIGGLLASPPPPNIPAGPRDFGD